MVESSKIWIPVIITMLASITSLIVAGITYKNQKKIEYYKASLNFLTERLRAVKEVMASQFTNGNIIAKLADTSSQTEKINLIYADMRNSFLSQSMAYKKNRYAFSASSRLILDQLSEGVNDIDKNNLGLLLDLAKDSNQETDKMLYPTADLVLQVSKMNEFIQCLSNITDKELTEIVEGLY